MKSNEVIIGFIGDTYDEYSEFWNTKYNKLNIDSEILFDTFHTELIYNLFDEIKSYIRRNIDDLDLSKYDYDVLHYLIPDKDTLINTVLCKMNVPDNIANRIMLEIDKQ